jgi:hypothetical protein
MLQILVYGDSLSWGIIPNTRRRLGFAERWPGVMEGALVDAGHHVRVIEDCLNGRRTDWNDPFKPGRNGLDGVEQRIEINSPLELVISTPRSATRWRRWYQEYSLTCRPSRRARPVGRARGDRRARPFGRAVRRSHVGHLR